MTSDYIVKSLGYRTDFIFNRFDGSVVDKGEYILATTESNPHYFWGNLLLFKRPPQKGDFRKWQEDFQREFKEKGVFHQTFAWDSPEGEKGDIEEFVENGFNLENSIVLTTHEIQKPRKFNDDIELFIIEEEEDFENSILIQTSSANDTLSKKSWEDFYRTSMKQYRSMISHGKGRWFGAKVDGLQAGCLGIFTDGNVGRFQIVSTSPEYQRRGVCSTLVYKSTEYALKHMNVDTLVMVADENYHAAKIYESVGFNPTERQIGLCWWDKERHG